VIAATKTLKCLSDLTIIVPVKDDHLIKRCLASIDVVCPILVVLNGATKEFSIWLHGVVRNYPEAEVVEISEPGLGRAYNVGIESCRTEYVLLMDSDCVFLPGCIDRLRRNQNRALLSKGYVSFEDSGYWSAIVAKHRTYNTSSFINAFSPPLMLSRSGIRLMLGHFFDADLTWSEDFEFDRRVRQKGIAIHRDRQAVVSHPPISPLKDLRSAINYGKGYGQGIKKGLFPEPKMLKGRMLLRQYLRLWTTWRYELRVPVAIYGILWMLCYRIGCRSTWRPSN
jgi:glycosyltransferase involved in cell wall biosynthesis